MVSLGLLVTSALAAVAGALFWHNGLVVLRKRRHDAPWAVAAYAIGWFALGTGVFTDAARFLIGFMPAPDEGLYTTLVWLKILATATTLGGFTSYILYAWTGKPWSHWFAAIVAAGHAAFWLSVANGALPGRVVVGTWATRMEFMGEPALPGNPLLRAAVFVAPILILVVAYLAFWPRVSNRGQRFRLVAVALSLGLYLLAASVQGNTAIDPDGPWLAFAMALMALGGLLAHWAFQPPAAWREQWGISAYD